MIILGDFNINLASRKIPAKWSHLKNILNLSQLVSVPTRVAQTSSTLVDHIYSNEPDNIHFMFRSILSVTIIQYAFLTKEG